METRPQHPGSLLTYTVAVTFSILLALTALRGAELLLVSSGPRLTLDATADVTPIVGAQGSSAPGTGSTTGSTRFR
ncbi:hypothetical protein L6R52_14575 [Myxococcota bacterium]|nr:hypothetical protein [Myxococcota bacterium]